MSLPFRGQGSFQAQCPFYYLLREAANVVSCRCEVTFITSYFSLHFSINLAQKILKK